MKTAQAFHVYLAPGLDAGELAKVLADIGLEARPLPEMGQVEAPALVLLPESGGAPEGLAEVSLVIPPGAPATALRELIRVAMENIVLKNEVRQYEEQARRFHRQFEELNRIGIALSAERDISKLQEFILTTMRQLTNADGASLWLKTVGDQGQPLLFLASSQNNSIDNTYQAFTVPVDQKSVVGYTVSVGSSQIYDDAYNPPPGKPQGGRVFDAQYGYRTKSMLTVPMRNYNHEVVGAVQLINAKRSFDTKLSVDTVKDEVVSFRPEDLEMIESIASQAAVALDNKNLLDSIQALFDGFVQASVTAIEQRDPSTAGHSGRVEKLTSGLAHALNELGAGNREHCHDACDTELGESPAGERVRLDREPIGFDNAPEDAGDADEDQESDCKIARDVPATSEQDIRHDRQRECEGPDNGDAPERRCPAQHRRQGLSDVLVLTGGRFGDHRCESDDERSPGQEHRIDRSTVPPAWLGLREELYAPGRLGCVVSGMCHQ